MVRNATRMEPTFYEENTMRQRYCGDNVKVLKRTMTLDLNANSGQPVKRMKLVPVSTPAPMLSSPDYKKLNINTPEIEKMLMGQSGLPTPTPGLFPKPITEEQAAFTRGFEEALHELQHHSDSSQGAIQHVDLPRSSSSSSSSGNTYMTLDSQYPPSFGLLSNGDNITVKEEPQTVPLGPTPPMSPIDMESQERYKLERKRERNRVAASKCRRRKLERIARLEDKVRGLKTENSELSNVVAKLKEHVCSLKEQVLEHVQSGCQIVLSSGHFSAC
ncbi:transcription factor Jun-like [Macrosteles quadrilineatus]|uniref:transcription factor Jun-like n=1 Tax=Macrosteles quadrilineatus TaxID=74068 RepID=UPI0023E2136E|nr:transcription factor Jun-like [Macrosteles quadrilineatus]XP_054278579.1 transcription factor Jun-like [Macrosteles quadrilineatus]